MRGLVVVFTLGAMLGSSRSGVALADSPVSVPAAGCTPAPATGLPHATVPPELQTLEQKTQHVHLHSIRLSYRLVFVAPTGTAIFDDITDARFSPNESTSTWTLGGRSPSGKSESETRKILEIGDVTYKYEPASTRGDGGRPWVRERRKRSQPGSHSMSLGSSIKQLSDAESIIESGTTELDGQQVSQFTATFAPGVYPQSKLPFGDLLEKACSEPVQIDFAIASSGLLVRENVSANYLRSNEAVTTTGTTEILATDFPFSALRPPPAKRTISAAALQRFRSAQLSKELKKIKKRHEHNKKRH